MKDIVLAFDFDGVIADSVNMLYDVFCCFMNTLGLEANMHEFNDYNGMSLYDVIKDVRKRNKILTAENDLLQKYYDIINIKYDEIILNKDVEVIIKELFEKGYTLLISSSANQEYILRILERNNINEYFEEIITIDEYGFRSKPSSDLYDYIANKYLSKRILAVEDSENGLIAAFNAGIRVVYYDNKEKQISAPYHYKVSDFQSIRGILDNFEDGFFLNVSNICFHIIDEKNVFSERERKEIDVIWNKSEDLYNGNIVGFKSLSYGNKRLDTYIYKTCYKEMYACKIDKNLKNRIIPLAVSAITMDKNKNVLLSKRKKVTEYVGSYEFIPSGGINIPEGDFTEINYKNQIMQELKEELGINDFNNNDFVIEVLGICYDGWANDMDICMCIQYKGEFNKDSFLISEEYEENDLKIVPYDSVNNIFGNELIFTSKKILNALIEGLSI